MTAIRIRLKKVDIESEGIIDKLFELQTTPILDLPFAHI